MGLRDPMHDPILIRKILSASIAALLACLGPMPRLALHLRIEEIVFVGASDVVDRLRGQRNVMSFLYRASHYR